MLRALVLCAALFAPSAALATSFTYNVTGGFGFPLPSPLHLSGTMTFDGDLTLITQVDLHLASGAVEVATYSTSPVQVQTSITIFREIFFADNGFANFVTDINMPVPATTPFTFFEGWPSIRHTAFVISNDIHSPDNVNGVFGNGSVTFSLVPGPIVGAGIPALLLFAGALVLYRRRPVR